MPWLIRTSIARRLGRFFKLVSPPKRIYVYPTVMPVVDHERIMKTDIYTYLIVAGNIVVQIFCLDDEELSMLYGNWYIDTDGNAGARTPRFLLYYPDDSQWYTLFDFNAMAANEVHNIRFNKEDISSYQTLDANTEFYCLPNELIEGGCYHFFINGGLAGDEMVFKLKLQSIPAVKEFLE